MWSDPELSQSGFSDDGLTDVIVTSQGECIDSNLLECSKPINPPDYFAQRSWISPSDYMF